MSKISKLVQWYYAERGLKYPEDADTALDFALTEMAECTELLLARKGGWVRNNEQEAFSKPRLGEELGDVLMMVLVAGIVEGLDPVECLVHKIGLKAMQKLGVMLPDYTDGI